MEAPTRNILADKDVNVPLSPSKGLGSLKPQPPMGGRAPSLALFHESRKRSLGATVAELSEDDAPVEPAAKRLKPSSHQLSRGTVTSNDDPTAPHEHLPMPSATPRISDASGLTVESDTLAVMERSGQENTAHSSQEQVSTFSSSSTLVESVVEPSAAEVLRLRLRFALFKVRTDQIEAPISRLEYDAPPPSPKPDLLIRDPPEETMRAFHQSSRKTTHPSSRTERRQVLEPGPEISAARYGPWQSDSELRFGPLISPRPEVDQLKGPYYSARKAPAIEETHDRDDDSDEEIEDLRLESGHQYRYASGASGVERDLTSSVVKGKAADSLLRLGSGT